MKTWTATEAADHCAEMIEACVSDGPQRVTLEGGDVAIVTVEKIKGLKEEGSSYEHEDVLEPWPRDGDLSKLGPYAHQHAVLLGPGPIDIAVPLAESTGIANQSILTDNRFFFSIPMFFQKSDALDPMALYLNGWALRPLIQPSSPRSRSVNYKSASKEHAEQIRPRHWSLNFG